MSPRPILSTVPTVSVPALVAILAVHAGLKALFFWGPYQARVASPVETWTLGLITAVTLAGVLSWVVLVGAGIVGVGRLRPSQLGLTAAALREAVPVLVGLWALSQVAQVALGTAWGGAALAGPPHGTAAAAGQRLQADVGSGLLEETVYRGFLLVQVYGLLRPHVDRDRAVMWAIVASSLYFGINHIPAGLRGGLPLSEALLFAGHSALVGALFAVLFLRTGNLFVAAGAHALINDPVPLFSGPVDPSLVSLIAVTTLMLAWPTLAQRYRHLFTVGTVEGRPAL